MRNDNLLIDDVLCFLNEIDLLDELADVESEKTKTCKKTIVKEYKQECLWKKIKFLN